MAKAVLRNAQIDENRSQSSVREILEEDLCVHIFSVSAAMVGVCLTVIGLVRIVIAVSQIETLVDNLLAIDALLFLISCLLAYWSLRTRRVRKLHRIERLADLIFLGALLLMVAVCAIFAWALL